MLAGCASTAATTSTRPYVLSLGAPPGTIECAAELAFAHEFDVRRSSAEELYAVKETTSTGTRNRPAARRTDIVQLQIIDSVNTPIAEVAARAEERPLDSADGTREVRVPSDEAKELADAIAARCG